MQIARFGRDTVPLRQKRPADSALCPGLYHAGTASGAARGFQRPGTQNDRPGEDGRFNRGLVADRRCRLSRAADDGVGPVPSELPSRHSATGPVPPRAGGLEDAASPGPPEPMAATWTPSGDESLPVASDLRRAQSGQAGIAAGRFPAVAFEERAVVPASDSVPRAFPASVRGGQAVVRQPGHPLPAGCRTSAPPERGGWSG